MTSPLPQLRETARVEGVAAFDIYVVLLLHKHRVVLAGTWYQNIASELCGDFVATVTDSTLAAPSAKAAAIANIVAARRLFFKFIFVLPFLF